MFHSNKYNSCPIPSRGSTAELNIGNRIEARLILVEAIAAQVVQHAIAPSRKLRDLDEVEEGAEKSCNCDGNSNHCGVHLSPWEFQGLYLL